MNEEISRQNPRPPREPVFNPKAFEALPVIILVVGMAIIHAWVSYADIPAANAVYGNYAFIARDFWLGVSPFTSVSYALLHGSWMHFGFNAVAFFVLGSACWKLMGTARFLTFFVLTAFAGAVLFAMVRPQETTVLVGVSGVVFGLIAAIKRVDYRIRSLRGQDIRIPVLRFIGIIILFNLVIGFFPIDDGSGFAGASVAWEAHVGGFLFGWLITPWLVRFWPE